MSDGGREGLEGSSGRLGIVVRDLMCRWEAVQGYDYAVVGFVALLLSRELSLVHVSSFESTVLPLASIYLCFLSLVFERMFWASLEFSAENSERYSSIA